MVVGSSPVAVTKNSDIAPVSSKEFLDTQATIECGFTLKQVRDMIRTYSQVLSFSQKSYSFIKESVKQSKNKKESKKRFQKIS